jgi:hypothetical protein
MESIFRTPDVRRALNKMNECRVDNCTLKSSTFSKLIERTTRLKCTQKRKSTREVCRTKYFIKNSLREYLQDVPECMKMNCMADIKKFKHEYLDASNSLLSLLLRVQRMLAAHKRPTKSEELEVYNKYDGKEIYLERKINNTRDMIQLFKKAGNLTPP